MNVYINAGLISFFSSIFTTIILTPRFRSIAKKYNLEDKPNKRNQHTLPKVRLGGTSIVLGFFIANFFSYFYLFQNNNQILFQPLLIKSFIAIFIFFVLGLVDDLVTLSPFFRLFCQFIISASIWMVGIRIENINLNFIFDSFDVIHLSPGLSLIFTIIWISGITNAFNWLDGLDGLASGVTTIISLSFIFISFSTNNFILGMTFISLFGSNLGFLKDNFYPSKIMMGDGGSYFLGCSFAIFSILLNLSGNCNLLISLLIMIIPLVDMVAVIISRIMNGISPFYPDRRHLHHRILSLGLDHKETVLMIYFVNIFLSINLLFILNIYNLTFCLILNILSILFIFKILRKIKISN